ncbi:MAG: DNA-processing protein DprA [Chloroflexi bacterium]|nr:DNA-processing protein DprA [Chloroflexota bacterium]MCL5074814.1 DNA-processing protein DprA [Chloroflexota bacterium]
MNELPYWVGFNLVPGIGPAKLQRLREYFGDLESAWLANASEMERSGLDARAITSVVSKRNEGALEKEMEKIEGAGVTVLTWDSPQYPERLRHIYYAPPVLYVKGTIRPEDELSVAVVGTRKATAYGRQVTEEIVGELARSRVTIVSGLARGIDAFAHRVAIEAGGRTLAVLASGVDIIYPSENAKLAQSIVEYGALISEYPLGTRPEARNFPVRNRIISGLTLGTLVVEAGQSSGALITAGFALEQDRDVFAVPGGIFWPKSSGTNSLIQQGAKLVTAARDILEELNLGMAVQQIEMKELLPENEAESALLALLSTQPVHIDELGRNSGLPMPTVSSTLAMMELKGMVRQIGGMHYIRESRADYASF